MALSDRLRARARSLRAEADLLEAEALEVERGPSAPSHYTSATWPGGAKNFRRLIAQGALPATKVGRELLVRREDGDAALAPTRRARAAREGAPDDGDDAIAARLRSAGIRVGGRS